MRKLFAALGLVCLAAVLVYVLVVRPRARADADLLRVSGTIEITDAEVSFKIPGRVEARLVSEGEPVESGQPVARLESADLGQEVALRNAEVAEATAWLAELEAGSRPQEIAAAEAGVERARADVDRLKDDFERQEKLRKTDVISTREYDATRTAYAAAQARLKEEEERLKLIKEGARKETIEQARARVSRAREALALARTRLGYAAVTSPLDGVVLSENVEAGEVVAAGTPIVTVGDLGNVWLRAYVSETDLGRVKLGQRATVTTDTYPGKSYDGRISFIAPQAEFTPKNVQTEKERVKLVYRIKIDVPNPEQELKPGMPADAEISLKETNQGAR
jgi:HlyD family secretion protein